MAKAYWITCYRSIKNPDALAAYAKLAGPAIQAAGGRFVVRGTPARKNGDRPYFPARLAEQRKIGSVPIFERKR